MEAGLDLAGLLGEGGRQRGADLELRGGEHGAETELGGGSGQAGEGERTRLVGAQAGQPGAVAVQQLVAAAVAGIAVQRDAAACSDSTSR